MLFEGQYAANGLFPSNLLSNLTSLSASSSEFDIHGRINAINLDKLLLPNISLNIKLEFNTLSTIIVENEYMDSSSKKTKTSSSLNISDVRLFVTTHEISEALNLRLESLLSKKNIAMYHSKNGKIQYSTIPQNSSNYHNTSLYSGIAPEFVCCFLVPNAIFCGNGSDCLEFTPHDLSEFNFICNNENYPRTPYKLSFKSNSKLFARALSHMYISISKRNKNSSSMINKENYEKHMIFCEDLSTGRTSLLNLNDKLQHANVGVNCVFSSPTKEPLTVVLYLLIPSKFTASSDREINLSY